MFGDMRAGGEMGGPECDDAAGLVYSDDQFVFVRVGAQILCEEHII